MSTTSRAIALLLFLGACSGDKDGTSPDGTDTTDTTEESGDTGSGTTVPDAVVVSDVSLTPLPTMGTVIEATWTTDVPVTARVRFTVDGMTRETATSAATTSHRHLLVGVPPEAAVDVGLVHDVTGGESVQAETATAGTLPGAPGLTASGTNDRFLVLPLVDETANESSLAIIDPMGRVVWQHADDSGLSVFRAHVARDGSGIIYAATLVDGGPNPNSKLVYVGWDGVVQREVMVPYLAHDFVETEDGSIVSLAYEFREDPTLGGVEGNRLVKVAADGTVEGDVWSAWDCYDPNVHESIDLEHGWIHANALDHDEATGRFLVGMRNLTTLASVDIDTDTCVWGFGGSGGTVAITSSESFLHQHQFEYLGDGMLVFDNSGAAGFESRVLEYRFDPDAGTASLERVISTGRFSFILGDVHRLDDGDTMITWSVPDTVERIAEDDTVVWSVTADNDDLIFGFTEVAVDPARPDLGVLH